VSLWLDPEIYGVSDRLVGVDPGNGIGFNRTMYWNMHTWTTTGD
jgi:hypothetical protein